MNPAISLLLRFHFASRVRRVKRAITSTRRMVLTIAAIALGAVWLGQTIASVVFREPYEPESFHRWTSLILSLYFGWHFIRVAYKRPDHAIEWSDAEEAQLVSGPFQRRDLLLYRFLIILTSAVPKALLTAFVLMPDLWWSGLPGIVLALVFLECFRMAIDLAVSCLGKKSYLLVRVAVFAAILATLGWGATYARLGSHGTEGAAANVIGEAVAAAEALRDSELGRAYERPFVVFADVITAQSASASLALNMMLSVLMVAAVMFAIERLDALHERVAVYRQRVRFDRRRERCTESASISSASLALPRIPRLGGMGPVMWRQYKAADRYRGSLAVAVAIPAVLSCLPLFSMRDATYAFLAVVAAVVFYSFVLLPEAIKFDFRLDCDHLAKLKMLPIPRFRLVVGQLAVPILVATGFQCGLFLLAGTLRPVSVTLILSAMLLSLPINILFVAIDNLIFLLYPHRPTQEGFEAFVRTILKFTFKSVLLGFAGAFVLFWSLSARFLVDIAGVPQLITLTFVAGVCAFAWLVAALALLGVTRAFDRFDVSVSVPA